MTKYVLLGAAHWRIRSKRFRKFRCDHTIAGVGKLFVRRATFEKNVAAEGRALSLQNRKVYSLCKKIHIHIKHRFCILHSGTFNAIYTAIVRTETYTIFMKFYSSKTL